MWVKGNKQIHRGENREKINSKNIAKKMNICYPIIIEIFIMEEKTYGKKHYKQKQSG